MNFEKQELLYNILQLILITCPKKLKKSGIKEKNVITMLQYFPYSIHLSEAKLVDSAQL